LVFKGYVAKITNRRYTASKTKPFGFSIIRLKEALIPGEPDDNSNPPQALHTEEATFWLVEETPTMMDNSATAGTKYNNAIAFVEQLKEYPANLNLT